MTNVISQLFNPKYTRANNTSGGKIAVTGDGCFTSGDMCATAKNRWAERHADRAGADMLKSARWNSGWRFESQNDPTKPSSATIRAPASGPYRRTAVKVKVSEME